MTKTKYLTIHVNGVIVDRSGDVVVVRGVFKPEVTA